MRERAAKALAGGLSASFHAALVAGLFAVAPEPHRRGEVVKIEIEEARPPPEPPRPEATPEPQRRRAAVARPKPIPVKPSALPPPPNQPPPPEAAPAKKTPIRVGVSLSATTGAGGFAAPVGNTLYGKPPEQAPDPAEVKPYRSDAYAPPTRVQKLPELLECSPPKSEYPEEARQAGFEGTVRLRVVVDENGRVAEAKALNDPGKGLGAAAPGIARRYCRFRPAQLDGRAVATELVMSLPFQLD